jgi:acetylornithine deacetylase
MSSIAAGWDEPLRILGDLVAQPTVTGHSNLELIAHAQERLDAVGAPVVLTRADTGDRANLFATIGPMVDGGVVLSGHTDVVPAGDEGWPDPPFVATRRGDRIHGRGTADMKGFIACVLAMVPRFAAADLGVPVHVALTYDEEIGCEGAPLLLAALDRDGPRPAVAIVGEPTGMRIAEGHKGCYEYTTIITGVEGHGSAPSSGVNAVEAAARYVARLGELAEELRARAQQRSPFAPPETTINVGTVRGGSARNVVAGLCTIEFDLRPVDVADAELAFARLDALDAELGEDLAARSPDASLMRTTVGAVDGLEVRAGSPAVSLMQGLLDDPEPMVVAYSTEAGLYQLAGIPAVVCGPGHIEVAHRPDEYIEVSELDRCLTMLERLAVRLAR